MTREIQFPLFTAEHRPGHPLLRLRPHHRSRRRAPTTRRRESDDWGWYFVIQELPGEPRFGLDIEFDPDDDADDADHLERPELGPTSRRRLPQSGRAAGAGVLQPAGRRRSRRSGAATPPTWPSILFQRPVMIAVHAREMLEKLDA